MFVNVNQVYMAGLMAAPMVVIEILLMSGMYPNRKKNAVIVASFVYHAANRDELMPRKPLPQGQRGRGTQ